MNDRYKVYGYRWLVLAVFMFINMTFQVLLISYTPISGPAAAFYGVSDLKIGLLTITFVIAFVLLSIPVSWVIDTYGLRLSISIGAVLMGIFGLVRGLAGNNYPLVLLSTVGIAIAQPFMLNAWTKVPANWFAEEERATAVGLVIVASLVGSATGRLLTPLLTARFSISTVQLIYGSLAAFSSVLFIVISRERPPTPPGLPGQDVRTSMLDGLKHALSSKPFWLYLLVSFIGMGIINGVTTRIENIIRPRGFTPVDAETLGALLLISGILGAFVIPPFSDKQRKRTRYLLLGFILAIPSLIGLAFTTNIWILLGSVFALGFFLVSTFPIGMQYAAEITQPTPEGTSNGVVQLVGQASFIFVYILDTLKNPDGTFTSALLLSLGLLAVCVMVILRLNDPSIR